MEGDKEENMLSSKAFRSIIPGAKFSKNRVLNTFQNNCLSVWLPTLLPTAPCISNTNWSLGFFLVLCFWKIIMNYSTV